MLGDNGIDVVPTIFSSIVSSGLCLDITITEYEYSSVFRLKLEPESELLPIQPIYNNHKNTIKIIRKTGFQFFFLLIRMVAGMGKQKIHPNTHSHVRLFLRCTCAYGDYYNCDNLCCHFLYATAGFHKYSWEYLNILQLLAAYHPPG